MHVIKNSLVNFAKIINKNVRRVAMKKIGTSHLNFWSGLLFYYQWKSGPKSGFRAFWAGFGFRTRR